MLRMTQAPNLLDGMFSATRVLQTQQPMYESDSLIRVRPPRTTPLDGTLRVYDARAATGADVLRRVNNGAYRNELFVAYAQLQVRSPAPLI